MLTKPRVCFNYPYDSCFRATSQSWRLADEHRFKAWQSSSVWLHHAREVCFSLLIQYFISVARVYDWTVSTPVSLWAPSEHVRVSIMQAGVKSSRNSLLRWSFLLVFFTEQIVINDIYEYIMQNNCSTSLANRLLASRSAFWGTEGTTVLLCREIWDSCTHANTKWATCEFTCMVHDGIVVIASNTGKENERKQNTKIQRNKFSQDEGEE